MDKRIPEAFNKLAKLFKLYKSASLVTKYDFLLEILEPLGVFLQSYNVEKDILDVFDQEILLKFKKLKTSVDVHTLYEETFTLVRRMKNFLENKY